MGNNNNLSDGISAMFGDYKVKNDEKTEKKDSGSFLSGRKRREELEHTESVEEDRTSLVVNRQQYKIIRAIARQESMTIKDLVYAMFSLGIDRYEQKHGKVNPDENIRNNNDLF